MRLFWTLAHQISPSAGGQNRWLTIVTLIIRIIIIIINFIIVIIPSTTRAWIQNILSGGCYVCIVFYRLLKINILEFPRVAESTEKEKYRPLWCSFLDPCLQLRFVSVTYLLHCCSWLTVVSLMSEENFSLCHLKKFAEKLFSYQYII